MDETQLTSPTYFDNALNILKEMGYDLKTIQYSGGNYIVNDSVGTFNENTHVAQFTIPYNIDVNKIKGIMISNYPIAVNASSMGGDIHVIDVFLKKLPNNIFAKSSCHIQFTDNDTELFGDINFTCKIDSSTINLIIDNFPVTLCSSKNGESVLPKKIYYPLISCNFKIRILFDEEGGS